MLSLAWHAAMQPSAQSLKSASDVRYIEDALGIGAALLTGALPETVVVDVSEHRFAQRGRLLGWHHAATAALANRLGREILPRSRQNDRARRAEI